MADTPAKRNGASPQRSPQRSAQTAEPDVNPYYAEAAGRFRIAKYLTILILIVFILTSVTFNRNEITIENLQYLMKFISFTNTETSITAAKINYSSSDKTRLSLFIGDLCYLSPNGYALYDSRGNTIMTDSIKYTFPILRTSAKFALCYDLGGNAYSLYNTFSRLTSGTLEYPITDGDIADSGAFVISTSTREYRTAVQLYDSDFKLTSRILRENYLADVKLKADASEAAVMTVGSENGSFVTTIDLITPGHDSVRKSASLSGIGYSLEYTANGFAVITDESIVFYDSELNLMKIHTLPSSLVLSDCSDKYLTCVCSTGIIGNTYTAVVYDTTGRQVFEGSVTGKLASVSHDDSGEYIFILAGSTVTRVNLVNRKIGRVEVNAGSFGVLAQSPDSFLLALGNYALTYTPADFGEHYFDRDTETAAELN